MRHILVVDDEANIRQIVSAYLRKEGYKVSEAVNGQEAIDIFDTQSIDLVILDLMMPIMDGKQVCLHIRRNSKVPIIMLTAKVEDEDVIQGIAGGADDYVRKPFSVRELMVRVMAQLRRYNDETSLTELVHIGQDDITVDFKRLIVKKKGQLLTLTPNEFKILKVLTANKNIVLSREQIIEKTFGIQFDGYDRTIDTHIKNLRQKIEDDPKKPKYIKTVYSMGYQFIND